MNDIFNTSRITTHNGAVTITSPTGAHRTFQVKTVQKGSLEGKRIVQLLAGDDNTPDGSWLGFGFVQDNGRVNVWTRHRGTDFEKFARMLEAPERYIAKGCTYLHESKCRRCNRRLTDPESIETGIGPVCAGR